jgi:RNA polymerase sigma factor (sigma-70 family)
MGRRGQQFVYKKIQSGKPVDYQITPESEHDKILAGLRRGHPAAYRIVENWLRGTIILPQFAVPRDDVDDVIQESLAQIIVIARNPEFNVHTSLKAFVRRIAMARAIDFARRRRITYEVSPELPGEFVDTLDQMARREDLQRIHSALSRLKAFCRDLIRWHYHEEKSYQVIADSTGRNVNTLRVHMFKCLQGLRKNLGM